MVFLSLHTVRPAGSGLWCHPLYMLQGFWTSSAYDLIRCWTIIIHSVRPHQFHHVYLHNTDFLSFHNRNEVFWGFWCARKLNSSQYCTTLLRKCSSSSSSHSSDTNNNRNGGSRSSRSSRSSSSSSRTSITKTGEWRSAAYNLTSNMSFLEVMELEALPVEAEDKSTFPCYARDAWTIHVILLSSFVNFLHLLPNMDGSRCSNCNCNFNQAATFHAVRLSQFNKRGNCKPRIQEWTWKQTKAAL